MLIRRVCVWDSELCMCVFTHVSVSMHVRVSVHACECEYIPECECVNACKCEWTPACEFVCWLVFVLSQETFLKTRTSELESVEFKLGSK